MNFAKLISLLTMSIKSLFLRKELLNFQMLLPLSGKDFLNINSVGLLSLL